MSEYYVKHHEKGTHKAIVAFFHIFPYSDVEEPYERPRTIDVLVQEVGRVEAQPTRYQGDLGEGVWIRATKDLPTQLHWQCRDDV